MKGPAQATHPRQPCRRCGGPKPPGQARRYCDPCRAIRQAEEREADRQRSRAYYLRTRVLTGRKPRGACVNADHMEVVTCAENSRRGDNAKLTYADVAEIRRLLAEGGLLQREIAARFGVTRTAVNDINCGRTWAAPGGALAA